MRKIQHHIIHCSDSDSGDVKIIRQWHLHRGWRDIGYHFVIRRDGVIEVGRPLEMMGAHCRGHNKNSIGTCLVGRTEFTPSQFQALKLLHNSLRVLFPQLKPSGHRDYTTLKTCPNFEVREIL